MGELELPAEEYAGTAQVSTGSTTGEVQVEVDLRGHFEPLDGRFHWYGRIAANEELAETAQSGETVVLTTPHGSAEGRLSDVDPWGRFRITGTGRPPF
ncbi:hypothetical protein ACVW00_001287 [Marmoricola sp. URHA0025 HA25]